MNEIMRFFFALLLVVSLMGLLWYALKKLGMNGGNFIAPKDRRLKMVEALPLDVKHKAILLRCDRKEHLVIIGANGETVTVDSFPIQDEKQND